MDCEGRERRRRGWVNRLRRLVYGLALTCAMPCAQAQERSDAAPRKPKVSPWMRAQQMLPSLANTANAMQLRLSAEASTELLRLDASMQPGSLGRPFAFAVGASDMGYLYLNLYSPDGQQLAGNWRIGSDEATPAQPLSTRDEWMQLRGARDEDTEIVISPQLVMHLDQMFNAPHKLEARLQYAPWTSLLKREGGDQRMPQIVLQWPF